MTLQSPHTQTHTVTHAVVHIICPKALDSATFIGFMDSQSTFQCRHDMGLRFGPKMCLYTVVSELAPVRLIWANSNRADMDSMDKPKPQDLIMPTLAPQCKTNEFSIGSQWSWRKECPSSAGAPKLIYGPGIDYPDLICAVLLFIEAADIQFSHFLMLAHSHINVFTQESNCRKQYITSLNVVHCAQWTQYTMCTD